MSVPIPTENEETYAAIRNIIRVTKRAGAAKRAAEDARTEARAEAVKDAEERARKASEGADLAAKQLEEAREQFEDLKKKRDAVYVEVEKASNEELEEANRKLDEKYNQKIKETTERIDKRMQNEREKDRAEVAAKECELLKKEEKLRRELAEIEKDRSDAAIKTESKGSVLTKKRKLGDTLADEEEKVTQSSKQDPKGSTTEKEGSGIKRQKIDIGATVSGAEQHTTAIAEVDHDAEEDGAKEVGLEPGKAETRAEDKANKATDGKAKPKVGLDLGKSTEKTTPKGEVFETKDSSGKVEAPESKKKAADLEKIKSDIDSLNQTKSQMVWLLKQVITAENRRKVEVEKRKSKKKEEKAGGGR